MIFQACAGKGRGSISRTVWRESGGRGTVGGEAVGFLESPDGAGGLRGSGTAGGAGIETQRCEHELGVFEAPVVTAGGIGVEFFPAGDVMGDDGVDRFGSTAAEDFIKLIITDWIGVAVDGERCSGVGVADHAEIFELWLGFRSDERAAEVEAHVVESSTSDGLQLFADDSLFVTGGRSRVNG